MVFTPANNRLSSAKFLALLGCGVWGFTAAIAAPVCAQAVDLPPWDSASAASISVGDPVTYEDSWYDASGILRRVRNESTGAERLAVIDDQGQIQAFVAPTARVNLRRYLGKRIGVTAKSMSETPGLAPSIIVDQVTLLSPDDVEATDATSWNETSGDGERSERTSAVRHVDFAAPIGSALRGEPSDARGVVVGSAAVGTAVQESQGVVPAQHEVLVDDPWGATGGEAMLGDDCAAGICGVQPCRRVGCRHCGGGSICGPPGWMWVRGEYFLVWGNGMHVPALVTTGGGTPDVAGVLGQPDTQLLLGNEDILHDGRSGFRIRFGGYWGPRRRLMWEGEYFGTGTGVYDFSASSDGNGSPVLARPFFNINPRDPDTGELIAPPLNDAELIAFPGILAGSIAVDVNSEVESAGGRLRWNICCREFACQHPMGGHPCCGPVRGPAGFTRLDFLAGYRYMSVSEDLTIREDLTTLTAPAGRFEIFDRFDTSNEFHGGEVGFLWEGGWRRWTLECLTKVALGNVHQVVDINGGTTFSPLTSPQQTSTGGLLAQSSNIGRYSRDDFGVLPELGLTLGLHLTPRLRATVGYTFFLLTPVVRPGDQIDLDVNPDQLPPAIDPLEGPLRPEFAFHETDFWANALNVGLDLRW